MKLNERWLKKNTMDNAHKVNNNDVQENKTIMG